MSLPYQQAQRFELQPTENIIDVTCTTSSPSKAAEEVAPVRVSGAEPITADSPPAGTPSKGTPKIPTEVIQFANGSSASGQPAPFNGSGDVGSSREWNDEKWDADAEAKAVKSSHVDVVSPSPLRADLEEMSKAIAPTMQRNPTPQKATAVAHERGRPSSEGTHAKMGGHAINRNGSQSKAIAPSVQPSPPPQKSTAAAQGRGSEGTHAKRGGRAVSRNGSQAAKSGECSKSRLIVCPVCTTCSLFIALFS
jgi:hypothetical protein